MNTPINQLLEADRLRRRAMIEADNVALEQLLADDLTWTHSSGVTEAKTEFINAITAGRVSYRVLDVSQDQVRAAGDVFIHQGTLTGLAVRDEQTKALCAKFLALWRKDDQRFQLAAWQSTNTDTGHVQQNQG